MRLCALPESCLPLIVAVAVAVAAAGGCDKERPPPPEHKPDRHADPVPWSAPDETGPIAEESVPRTELRLSGTRRFPACWELFEEEGAPIDPFPYADPAELAVRLASCEIEASAELEDGTRLYAWGTRATEGSRASDLRLAVWNPDGGLRFTHVLDRSKQAPNWVANFRRSFVTPLPPRHVCYGTLWEGDTQVACVGLADGEERWIGSLPFWSGIVPVPGEGGFIVADLSAVTKRYPYSGEEMKHRKLEGLGGRAGYYATDGQRLYFAPSRTDTPTLVAYDLKTFEEAWRVPLPGNPSPSLAVAFDEHDVLLVKLDEVLHAVDTETGEVRWAYEIGEDVPSIVAHDGALYVLCRRPERPNQLVAIDPESGERAWVAPTPAGTLELHASHGALMLGSVRAVQRVDGVDQPDEADGGD